MRARESAGRERKGTAFLGGYRFRDRTPCRFREDSRNLGARGARWRGFIGGIHFQLYTTTSSVYMEEVK